MKTRNRFARYFVFALALAGNIHHALAQGPLPCTGKCSADAERTTAAQVPDETVTLKDGTPVVLETDGQISSADAIPGATLTFNTVAPVKVAGLVVIAQGAPVTAIIAEASKAKRVSRNGKLRIQLKSVQLVTQSNAPLRMKKKLKGKVEATNGDRTAGQALSSELGLYSAIFWVPIWATARHGNDRFLPAHSPLTAYIDGDVSLAVPALQVSQPKAQDVTAPEVVSNVPKAIP